MFYNLKSKTKSEAELLIYGDIGENPFADESVSAKSVVKQLTAMGDVETIQVRINSFGGSVADGLTIVSALKRHPARKIVTVDGVAVSAGSLIAMAGDEIHMNIGSLMMIHAPWSGASGNAAQMRQTADTLDKIADAMVGVYVAKTNKSDAEIRALLKDGEDHWYTAQEAIEAGFADKLVGEPTQAAHFAPLQMAMAAFRGSPIKPEVEMSNASVEAVAEIDADVEVVAELPEEPKAACKNCEDAACEGCEGKAPANSSEGGDSISMKLDNAIQAAVADAVARAKAEAEVLIAQARAEVESAQAKLQLEIEAKELKEVQAECQAKFAFIPHNSIDLGSAIKALRKANPDACAKVEAALLSANALLTDPLKAQMASIGTNKEVEQLDAKAKVEALAKEKLLAGNAKTIEQARSMVYSEQPELQIAIREEG